MGHYKVATAKYWVADCIITTTYVNDDLTKSRAIKINPPTTCTKQDDVGESDRSTLGNANTFAFAVG